MWNEMDISDDIKKMLNKLRERKQEMDGAKRWQSLYMVALLLSTGILMFDFNRFILSRHHSNVLGMLSGLTDTRFLVLLCIVCFAAGQLQYYSKKYKSKKEKFEKLRAETVDRLYSPWVTSTLAGKRDAISKAMKAECDINISYIN